MSPKKCDQRSSWRKKKDAQSEDQKRTADGVGVEVRREVVEARARVVQVAGRAPLGAPAAGVPPSGLPVAQAVALRIGAHPIEDLALALRCTGKVLALRARAAELGEPDGVTRGGIRGLVDVPRARRRLDDGIARRLVRIGVRRAVALGVPAAVHAGARVHAAVAEAADFVVVARPEVGVELDAAEAVAGGARRCARRRHQVLRARGADHVGSSDRRRHVGALRLEVGADAALAVPAVLAGLVEVRLDAGADVGERLTRVQTAGQDGRGASEERHDERTGWRGEQWSCGWRMRRWLGVSSGMAEAAPTKARKRSAIRAPAPGDVELVMTAWRQGRASRASGSASPGRSNRSRSDRPAPRRNQSIATHVAVNNAARRAHKCA